MQENAESGSSAAASRSDECRFDTIGELERLAPHVLTGVKDQVLSTTLLGDDVDLPIVVAPVGGRWRFNPEGEVASAGPAARANAAFTLSMATGCSLEDVARGGGKLWLRGASCVTSSPTAPTPPVTTNI